jgi:hypothetical protein
LRVAFVGTRTLLDGLAPSGEDFWLEHEHFATGPGIDFATAVTAVTDFDAHVTVVLDPTALPPATLASLPGTTLGVLTDAIPETQGEQAALPLDRLVSFEPALTGTPVGSSQVWRAIPPPVSDKLYADVPAVDGPPRAMSVGRSTAHREATLAPAKHHHDLLDVIHGVSGPMLMDFLREHNVGVYIGRKWGGAFGWQVGMHLAAGQLLLSDPLKPAHGLEAGLDYLEVPSPGALVFMLDRMRLFPEMYHRLRVRGRFKAEQFRASALFVRLIHDLMADVAAFGRPAGGQN